MKNESTRRTHQFGLISYWLLAISLSVLLPINLSFPQCVSSPTSLVSWWAGEGTANDIYGTNNGTLINGATFVTGKVGQAFSFDGENDYVSVPGTFGGGPEATVEAWIKTNGTTGDFQSIVSSTELKFIHLQIHDGGSIVAYVVGGQVEWVNMPIVLPTPTGVYRHIAFSVKSGDSRLYVDGILVGTNPMTFNTIQSTSNLRIGCGYLGRRFFKGEIDEVSIYNRALSVGEIQSIYNAGSAGKCKTNDITSTAGRNGSITPDGITPVNYGGSQTYTITANPGYDIADVTVDRVSVGAVTRYTFTNVTQSHEISATFSITSSVCVTAPTGLVGWWTGDGNTDDIVGTNNGTLMNGATFVTGKVGQAFSFDGVNDYVSVPGTFGGGPEATVEAWIKPNGTTGNFQSIVSSPELQFMHLQIHAGGNIVAFVDGGVWLSMPIVLPTPTGVYRHIAFSIKSGGSRLYVDGQLIGTNTLTFSTIVPASNLRIGSGWDGRYFKGEIDEVSIYNRALSEGEIQSIYNAGSAGKCKTNDITSTAGANGSITPLGLKTVNYGGSQSYTITADPGYHIDDVLVDGTSVGAVTDYAFSNVIVNHTIFATFTINTYNITSSSAANGCVTPDGTTPVNYDGSQTYTITADPGYYIVYILVDGDSVGAVTSYIFSNVIIDHTISAQFGITSSGMAQVAKKILIPYLYDNDIKIRVAVRKAIENIDQSLAVNLWEDINHLTNEGKKVFDNGKQAVKELTNKNFTLPFSGIAAAAIEYILTSDQNLAQVAINDAVAACNNIDCQREINKANEEMVNAANYIAQNDKDKALDHYKKAWEHALKAIKKLDKGSIANNTQSLSSGNSSDIPVDFSINQNYPNPFNPSTIIKFGLPEASFVTLKVYNMLGQEIKTLVSGYNEAGNYNIKWNGDNNFGNPVPNGTYIYRIISNNYVKSMKMILLK